MRVKGGIAIVGLVLVALVLGACGSSGPSAEEKREAAERKEHVEERKEREAALAKAHACEGQLGEFLDALEELEGRLEVGVNYNEYFQEVGNAQVAYNRIPINSLSRECLSQVGLPSEDAFNSYRDAANYWEECFQELTCEEEDPELQAEWSKAARQFSRAQTDLVAMGRP